MRLEIYSLENGKYVSQQPAENGRFWIKELDLFLGVWEGERLKQNIHWLRWWDAQENMLLWSSEKAQQEHKRAETLAAKLRELGVDPDTLT